MTDHSTTPTSDESFLAALSHLLGAVVALLIWVLQKDRSPYLRFQALQAAVYDLATTILGILVFGCINLVLVGSLSLAIADIALLGKQNPTAEPARILVSLMTATPFAMACLTFLFILLVFIPRLVATIQTAQGRDFRYPWLGNTIERSLNSPQQPGAS